MSDHNICPFCQSQSVTKWGFFKNRSGRVPRFRCKQCKKTFSRQNNKEQRHPKDSNPSSSQAVPISRKQRRALKKLIYNQTTPLLLEKTTNHYSREEILDVLLHLAFNQEFIKGGTEQYQQAYPHREVPSANTVYERLKELKVETVLQDLSTICGRITRMAIKRDWISGPVELAIDEHNWMYYGDGDQRGVIYTKRKNGTNRAYQFMTLCIVWGGPPLTIGLSPMEDRTVTTVRDRVKSLLKQAQNWVSIRCLYGDRGFYKAPVIKVLEELDVPYFIRAYMHQNKKETYRKSEQDTCLNEYTIKRKAARPYVQVQTNLLLTESQQEGEEVIGFVTSEEHKKRAARYVSRYRNRWGIETSYRVIQKFLIRTVSRKYQVRVGIFSLAVVLYNLWLVQKNDMKGDRELPVSLFVVLIQPRKENPMKPLQVFSMISFIRQLE